MGITNSNKEINVTQMDCRGTAKVTIALSAAPEIASNPTDIILLLDRSGSMQGEPLANMKLGAGIFIDIIDQATDGSQDGIIGLGSRIGVISFSDTAVADTPLTTSVTELKTAVDSLKAGGFTNHGDAFSKAMQLFDPNSSNAKVIVLFTDGKTTVGIPPAPLAEAAKNAGIIIYCIGLIGSDGIDTDVLNDWASDPDSAYVAVTPDADDLENLFAAFAANISKPGATNIVIDEAVTEDFQIISVLSPEKGTVVRVNDTTLQWKIPELGVAGNEGAALEFLIRHVGQISGTRVVNESISYSDEEGNIVVFPNPTVEVNCGPVVNPEPCPPPVNLTVEGCQDSVVIDMGDTYLESLGRIVQLDVTIKQVCPNKRVALAIILTEVDSQGTEHPRGMKTMTIPAHHHSSCKDILVKCVKFVLPEDLNVSGCCPDTICGARNLNVRFIAHTIDTDYQCCDFTLDCKKKCK